MVGNAGYLNSIGVLSFGAFAESEEQEIENPLVALGFLEWVGRWRDLEAVNLGDGDLGA